MNTLEPVGEASAQTEGALRSRINVNEDVIEGMKGAAKVAMIALGVAAQATQNVPYLGAISTALTEFMKIQDEVDECKDDCRATIADAQNMKALIERFRDKCVESGKEEGVLNRSLREAFTELESVVLECIIVLQKCKVDSKRKRDRLRLYFKRSTLAKSVKDCSAKMAQALQRFNTSLQIDQVILLDDIRLAIDELREVRTSNVPQVATPYAQSAWRLRAAPLIFYGRESEVDHALYLILHQAPARVAVLGSGGIGKTSIALTILHHPDVEALYGNQRCFVSCEATITAGGIVRALADAVDLRIERDASPESAQHRLLSHLRSTTGIVCLDNLETPWDADTAAVEELLTDIASTPSLALLITSRVTDTPLIGWSTPPLDPIAPFSIEAALQTWDAICSGQEEYARKVSEAVDCVPLAVTLLARLARTETAKVVWARWELERTDIIQFRGVKHRLNNIGVSIELSLQALEYREAIDVLAIICMLDGMSGSQFVRFDEALKDRISVRRAVVLLKQSSLVYSSAYGWVPEPHDIYVLSPIREHMQKHHTVSDDLFLALLDVMSQDIPYYSWDVVLKLGLKRQGLCRERCLEIVMSHPLPLAIRDVEVLTEVISAAHAHEPQIQSRLYWSLKRAWLLHRQWDHALAAMTKVIECDEESGDTHALFRHWVQWIDIFRRNELKSRSDPQQHMEDAQNAIEKVWNMGLDESREWTEGYEGYSSLAWKQHRVNVRRRELNMPIIRRSGLFLGNKSEIQLLDYQRERSYNKLISTSSPPWDLPLIFESVEWSQEYPDLPRYNLDGSLQ